MKSVNPEQVQNAIELLMKLDVSQREEKISEICQGDKLLEDTVRSRLEASHDVDVTAVHQISTTESNYNTKIFGHYKIHKQIGIGGMGVVFQATDTRLGRTVALKVLSTVLCQDEKSRKRFLAEAKAISKMDHPNVCPIYDLGETEDKQLYFAMPFYQGQELKDLMASGELSLGRAVDIMIQICSAIAAAHDNDVIHRDIKPANVFITENGTVKVLDFGIAKLSDLELTQTGKIMGTIHYMSPEQVNTDPIDHRSDIWSLGVLFYEMLAGKRPFCGQTALAISQDIINCRPDTISVHLANAPAICEKIIAKTLQIKPHDRYSNLDEMICDLKDLKEQLADSNVERNMLVTKPQISSGDTTLVMGDTLSEICQRLEKYVGESARLLVNSHSKDCDTLEELKLCLANELPEEHRNDFIDSVTGLASSTKLQTTTLSLKPQKKRISLAVISIVLVLLIVSGIGIFYAKQASQEVDVHEDFRGVTTDKIRVGMTAAFSGTSRELGLSMKLGIETYFRELNEAGGIHGRKLELVAVDDAYQPEKALENLTSFLDPKTGVFALLGNVGTPTAKAILPKVLEDNTLLFGTFSGAQLLRQQPPDKYVFNYRASYADETAAIVKYFTEKKSIKPQRIGVFYQNDSYGLDGLSGVQAALRKLSIHQPIPLASYERNTINVDNAVTVFIEEKENVDAIIIVASYKASANFTKLMRKGGYKGEFANVSFVGTHALAEEFKAIGSEYAEGVIISQVVPFYDSYASGVLKYRAAQKKYSPSEAPNFVSLEGYIIANIFCKALKENGRLLTTDSLIETLETLEDYDLGIGPTISFSKSKHQASHFVWGVRLTKDAEIKLIQLRDP